MIILGEELKKHRERDSERELKRRRQAENGYHRKWEIWGERESGYEAKI